MFVFNLSSTMIIAVDIGTVIVFSLFILYDVSKIQKEDYGPVGDAISLYLDFFLIFHPRPRTARGSKLTISQNPFGVHPVNTYHRIDVIPECPRLWKKNEECISDATAGELLSAGGFRICVGVLALLV